MMGDH